MWRDDGVYRYALPTHSGQLEWKAEGFKIIENSAKAKGEEIGVRGRDGTGRLTFLGFLFLVPKSAPTTSERCRDEALAEQKQNPTLRVLPISQNQDPDKIPVAVATYSGKSNDGKKWYDVRGFVATGDICGDLEFYSNESISEEDAEIRAIFKSYRLDPTYKPQFNDVFLFAEVLYRHEMFKAAGPFFEQALVMLGEDKAQITARRVTTDQAGQSYGISGDIAKARAIFTAAIAKDSDYPMYYYNLACADAEEKNLSAAREHLQQAFARKANVIAGESLPDPTKDDSFLPYRNDKNFWKFVEELR